MFTTVFEYSDKKRVLVTHRRFCQSIVLLPQEEEKLNQMTTSKLNQFTGGAEYNVNKNIFLSSIVKIRVP